MDPNANVLEQRRIRARIRDGRAQLGDRERLRELREALAEWIQRGGFAPTV